MPGYFSKFPVTLYKGTPSIDILKRTGFNESIREFINVFYTYTIPEGDRIDSIAHDYYDDVNYDWLIYQSNDIVDPYYQAPLKSSEFESYIQKKYGSVREAVRKVALYRNNFEGDDSVLSIAAYDALPGAVKKYWRPVVNALGSIGYERSTEDFSATTNQIISLQLEENDESFDVGEIVEKTTDANSFAEVVYADDTNVILQHIRGSFEAGDNIRGETSKVTKQIQDELFVQDVIPEVERVYYSPVSFYDLELERNEKSSEIYLVEKSQLQKIEKQLTNLLK